MNPEDPSGDLLPWGSVWHDPRAFERLFMALFKPLCAYCQFRFRLDPDLAKEVVHGAFIKLWEKRMSLSPDEPVRPYLYRIVINGCLDALKHERVKESFRREMLALQADGRLEQGLDTFDLKKLQAAIDAAIAELPEQMRMIFRLSRYEGLKYGEIAGRLQISVNTVETQMGRALKKLRARLAPYLPVCLIMMILNGMIK